MLSCSFVKGRDYDPDRERVEKRKLQKQVNMKLRGQLVSCGKTHFSYLRLRKKKEHYGKKIEQRSMRRH